MRWEMEERNVTSIKNVICSIESRKRMIAANVTRRADQLSLLFAWTNFGWENDLILLTERVFFIKLVGGSLHLIYHTGKGLYKVSRSFFARSCSGYISREEKTS
jgi:hypothetical protein